MDDVLLRRAQACGVSVIEGATINEAIVQSGEVVGVRLKVDGDEREYHAPITIDATGRARVLTRKLSHQNAQNSHVAFKVHLRNTHVAPNSCEIYFYPEGYGGLSTIERGLSNLCFITSAEQVKRHHSDPEAVVREAVMKNRRAAYTLAHAQAESEWLSASWERFGRQRPNPTKGLLAIGDSAAFIDPFTGSGMLMAFESGELAADVIVHHRDNLEAVGAEYTATYVRKFASRLRICGLLRRAAFKPRLASLAIAVVGASEQLKSKIVRATRSPNRDTHSPLRAG
jgi:flavin-dependent dehydrogenase